MRSRGEIRNLQSLLDVVVGNLHMSAVVGTHIHIGNFVPDILVVGYFQGICGIFQIDFKGKVMFLSRNQTLGQINDILFVP